jgi:hypothetical protein
MRDSLPLSGVLGTISSIEKSSLDADEGIVVVTIKIISIPPARALPYQNTSSKTPSHVHKSPEWPPHPQSKHDPAVSSPTSHISYGHYQQLHTVSLSYTDTTATGSKKLQQEDREYLEWRRCGDMEGDNMQ